MSAYERPRTAFVDLESVELWPTGLVVTLQSGEHLWQVECQAEDLSTFKAFQAKTANQLGLWIRHDSQELPYFRRANWQHAVGEAFRRGSTVNLKGEQ